MNLIENIVQFLRKPESETKGKAPEGTCPVCWGYQQYDAKIREVFRDKQIDVNNRKGSYMRIQRFVKKYIDGIRLKQSEVKDCPTCLRHSKADNHPITE
ncbi:hypothetical protein [Gelidibacter maritimus]|uniref:Uncharacterized protein n=1 Tax=Gelidibacter maritimus TaxID=2761487 RepID=A0A7W2M5R0_9FLAO|nr:hypothetical protein [Gelidibacter maritimus]MBA6153203.1 hypothetical protein [Gelidibacter maritimus]